MGLYGGGSAPPPPPDYTAEKTALIDSTRAGYQTQADDYNAAVSNYNSTLTNLQSGLNSLNSQISGLTVNDIWDDPSTAANENRLTDIQNTLSNGLNTFNSLNLGERPVFDPVINSQYGTLTVTNLPTLASANSSLADSLQAGSNSLQTKIDQLLAQRAAAETSVRNDFNSSITNFGNLYGDINNASIADDLGSLSSNLYSAQQNFNQFSNNPIAGQLYDLSGYNDTLTGLSSTLSGLQADKAAEQTRIADFEKGLFDTADTYYDTFGGLNIASEQGINDLQSQIDALQRQTGRFSSVLPYDLSQENAYINDLESQLSGLKQQRQDELNRITQAQTNFRNDARDLQYLAGDTSIYNLANINQLDRSYNDLNDEVSGFSSLLPYDFGSATSALTSARSYIDNLKDQRAAAIADLTNRVNDTVDPNSIPLYAENQIRNLYNPLNRLTTEAGLFSGNDLGSINQSLVARTAAIDDRLNELSNYRDQLEINAKQLLSKINSGTYYTLDDVTAAEDGTFRTQQDEIDLYNAQQAMDEVQAIMARLGEERARLEQDAANVEARNAAATGNLVIGAGGVPTFQNQALIDPMSMQQYYNTYVYNSDEEDPYATGGSPSSFSNALGIIKIG